MDFIIKFHGFSKFNENQILFKKIRSFITLPWGHVRSYTKFGPDRFSRFQVYWIQTDRQRPAKYIDRS